MSNQGMITPASRQQKIRMLLDELDAALRDLRENMANSGIDSEDSLGRLLAGLEVCFRINAAISEESCLSAAEKIAEGMDLVKADIAAMMKQMSAMIQKASETVMTRDEYMDKAIRIYEHRLKAMYIPTEDFRERVFEEFQRVFREKSSELKDELSRGFKLYHWSKRRMDEWKWVAAGSGGTCVVLFIGRMMGYAL